MREVKVHLTITTMRKTRDGFERDSAFIEGFMAQPVTYDNIQRLMDAEQAINALTSVRLHLFVD